MIELAPEDALRINLLLTQDVKAIRINESNMTMYALLKGKEAKIALNPTGGDEAYLKQVRELLSSHYLDSPAGFPVFMSRWTRMGQAGSDNLYALLKLGEPEAVVYAVNSPELNADQAAYAWWAMPSVEVALQLLSNKNVAQSTLAEELSAFLLEFLPFENDSNTIIQSIKLLLQNNLLSESQKQELWKKGQRKINYRIGFLHGGCEHLPSETTAHPIFSEIKIYRTDTEDHNPYQQLLVKLLSEPGQNYLATVHKAIDKLTDQDTAIALFHAMQDFFSTSSAENATIEKTRSMELPPNVKQLLEHAIRLSQIKEDDLIPVLSHTNAVGSVLRNKLKPITNEIVVSIFHLINR